VVLLFLSAVLYGKEELAKFESNHTVIASLLKRISLFFFFVLLVAIWLLTVASFIYGMIVDVKLGLRILGFGAAGVFWDRANPDIWSRRYNVSLIGAFDSSLYCRNRDM
jgi:hypothetical protein